MDRLRLLPALLALSLMGPTACAPISQTPQASAQSLMTLEQLKDRLVQYAADAKQPSDVSAHEFTKITGASFIPFKKGEQGGTAERQPLADGYSFYASFVPDNDPNSISTHQVFFYAPGGVGFSRQNKVSCPWKSEPTETRLVASGYRYVGEGSYKGECFRNFRQSLSDGKRVFDIKLIVYDVTIDGETASCVMGVHFSGSES